MSHADPLYQFRSLTVETIQKGQDTVITIECYQDGAIVNPSAATVSVYDPSMTAILDGEVAAINAGTNVSHTVDAADAASSSLGQGWQVHWTLTMPDGSVRVVRLEAALVHTRLYPPASWQDVFMREPGLDPDGSKPIHSLTLAELEPYLHEAWIQIENKLIGTGKRPWIVIQPSTLREPLILTTLALVFQSLVTRLSPAYQEQANLYREMAERSWINDVRYSFLASEDADAAVAGGTTPHRSGGQSPVWMGSYRGRRA